mgnify:CR=1 FL=1
MRINGLKDDSISFMKAHDKNYLMSKSAHGGYEAFYETIDDVRFIDYLDNKTFIILGRKENNQSYITNVSRAGDIYDYKEKDGIILKFERGLYKYENDNSIGLLIPSMQKGLKINDFDLKQMLSQELFWLNNYLLDEISVDIASVRDKGKIICLEALIRFGKVDTIHAPFTIDNKYNIIWFYPFVYTSLDSKEYTLGQNNILLQSSFFVKYLCESFLVSSLCSEMHALDSKMAEADKQAKVYIKKRVSEFQDS